MRKEKAYLYLEDGTVLEGIGFGARKIGAGEAIFTTSMNGYPESLTDPSYKGQLLVVTHPLVGNYGVPEKVYKNGILADFESESIKVEGLVISELTEGYKWNSFMNLDTWLESEGIPGIYGVDTRMLTKKIRDNGVLGGVLSVGAPIKSYKKYLADYEKKNFIAQVSPRKPIEYKNGRQLVVVVDMGVKHGILAELYKLGYSLVRVPYNYPADKILSYEPAGVVYSNGPGNPAILKDAIKSFTKVAEYKIPIFGICLGHQIATLAFGGSVEKMKFGHRAINKAVIDMNTRRSYITTHNHGYAVYPSGIPHESEVWFLSPDDNVVEGLIFKGRNIMTTQFHPEARPGTNDAGFIFSYFQKMINNAR
ncbi:MAG: glutamine-hydrolyzing carbamoyl-phosphate synthase small subunit [Candidatus Micrarchaeia archaeon]